MTQEQFAIDRIALSIRIMNEETPIECKVCVSCECAEPSVKSRMDRIDILKTECLDNPAYLTKCDYHMVNDN
jgi:hypothetical protein